MEEEVEEEVEEADPALNRGRTLVCHHVDAVMDLLLAGFDSDRRRGGHDGLLGMLGTDRRKSTDVVHLGDGPPLRGRCRGQPHAP
jgi:hypothetical protein